MIYELHVGALGGPEKQGPGTLKDAIELLDYLVDLGVNAVELLPMSQFSGEENWGYGTSHYYAIEYSGGGRDQYKYFIKECHRRGIAVIFDVVYNHFTPNAERAEWGYDTNDAVKNPYYWYEGVPSDYPAYQRAVDADARDLGGYVDNMSTGFAPRFYDEMVRKMFISSAVMLMEEFHVDGFRVDQTTSIHSYNVLHADGRPVPNANALRRQVPPRVDEHPAADQSRRDPDRRGPLGLGQGHAVDRGRRPGLRQGLVRRLLSSPDRRHRQGERLRQADQDRRLRRRPRRWPWTTSPGCSAPAGATMSSTTSRTTRRATPRAPSGPSSWPPTGRPLVGETRRYAEARCRFAFGATVLSAGTPMFLFGEEVGFEKDFLYNHIFANREDLDGYRKTSGQFLFAFYQRPDPPAAGQPGAAHPPDRRPPRARRQSRARLEAMGRRRGLPRPGQPEQPRVPGRLRRRAIRGCPTAAGRRSSTAIPTAMAGITSGTIGAEIPASGGVPARRDPGQRIHRPEARLSTMSGPRRRSATCRRGRRLIASRSGSPNPGDGLIRTATSPLGVHRCHSNYTQYMTVLGTAGDDRSRAARSRPSRSGPAAATSSRRTISETTFFAALQNLDRLDRDRIPDPVSTRSR